MTSLLSFLTLVLSLMGLPTDSPDCADRNIQPCGAQVDTSSGSAESGQFGDVKHISNGF